MKKYISIKIFMQGHVKNVQLAAVAVIGLGIAIFCSAYTVPENCTPSVTENVNTIYGNCSSVGVTATCVGDNTNDTVSAYGNNSGGSSTVGPMPFNPPDPNYACDITSWGDMGSGVETAVGVVVGVNYITASSSELSITSSVVDVTLNNGSCWYYTFGSTWNCGVYLPIVVSCLNTNDSITYGYYETTNSVTGCISDSITTFPGYNGETGPEGTLLILDTLRANCNSTAGNCVGQVDKVWHVYNRLKNNIDITISGDVATFTFNTNSSPHLTISDSQCGPAKTFN
jgi:hypothetical protein